jgi:bifunctional UDP-N-acetylglucosamine pyrophosphorylase / glucosamine-1-phosphate N-acetyltransferase
MTESALACLILAAGRGTRMHSDLPKVMHPVAGLPILGHVMKVAQALVPEKIIVVVGPAMEQVQTFVAPHAVAIQKTQRGTADAVRAATDQLQNFAGDIAVLYGDAALMTKEALQELRRVHAENAAAITISAFTPDDAAGYGRILLDDRSRVMGIIEAADATPQQKAITLCNGGAILFSAPKVWPLLDKIENHNAKHEFYLTDLVELAYRAGLTTAYAMFDNEAVQGVNDRVELAAAEALMQRRLRLAAMRGGVTMQDPDSVFLAHDTLLGRDVTLGPNIVFGTGCVVGDHVHIRGFCHIEGAEIAAGSIVGPFARLRAGTKLGTNTHIGNFVELKNSLVGAGSKINHLSYIGDAEIGSTSNIGAGAITCNYDGFRKQRTIIGNNAFIGSNAALVAPVTIGNGAFVGAGSVITNNVPADTLAVARGRQVNLENWGGRQKNNKKDTKSS